MVKHSYDAEPLCAVRSGLVRGCHALHRFASSVRKNTALPSLMLRIVDLPYGEIFDVMDCNDAFKTRLAVYKFEGDALAWWKAYKQAKGGDAWVLTLTWAAFKELFFLQFFPRAEQERLKREYHSIRQRASENSTEYMQRFLRLAGFLGQAAGTAEEQAKNFRWGLHKSILDHVMCIQFTDVAQVADAARNLEILRDRDDYDRSERSDKRAVVVTTVTTITTTTLVTTTGRILIVIVLAVLGSESTSRRGNRNSGTGATKGNRVNVYIFFESGSQQSRVPLRVILNLFATHVDVDTQESVVRAAGTCFICGLAGSSSAGMQETWVLVRLVMLARSQTHQAVSLHLTQDQAANTSGYPSTGALFYSDV
ncbi:zinc finger, CCHC-type, retrotransposon gag domain protein [Tanacetum coccineum]